LTFIPTTATATEKLKRLAKNHRKGAGTSLAVALDSVAQSSGYLSWKHVSECLHLSKTAPISRPPLPEVLQVFLADYAKSTPPSSDSKQAFQTGLVFSMDVKEAESMRLSDDFVECGDAWVVAAADIWPVFVHSTDNEDDTSLAVELEGDALLDIATDELGNFRHFRYCGLKAPETLEEAYALVMKHSFFAPVYLWVKGKFIHMNDVSELSVDGRVVYLSSPQGRHY
jgi:hypothetical protein